MIVRYEPWGAWVKLEREAALVAIDRGGARALGLDAGRLWDDRHAPPPSRPLEVHVAVTSRCAAGCEGCYLDARPDGIEPPHAAKALHFGLDGGTIKPIEPDRNPFSSPIDRRQRADRGLEGQVFLRRRNGVFEIEKHGIRI